MQEPVEERIQNPAADTAREVTAQYRRASAACSRALREMVIFGLMLERVEENLITAQKSPNSCNFTETPRRPGETTPLLPVGQDNAAPLTAQKSPFSCNSTVVPRHNGEENQRNDTTGKYSGLLKAWLAENCPEVNYFTAMDYRKAVRGLRRLAHIEDGRPLLIYLGTEPLGDEVLEEVRRRVLGIISHSSLRVLREAARGNALKGSRGLLHGRRALSDEEQRLAAEQLLRELSGRLDAYIRCGWAERVDQTARDDLSRALKGALKSLAQIGGRAK